VSAPRLVELAETVSTNDWMREHAGGLPDGAWVRADMQTGGRGRHGREWRSLPGNLFATTLVRPRPGEGRPHELSFVAALALAEALRPFVGRMRLSLKWPNDLLLGGAKCAGILIESVPEGAIVGFGANLAAAPAGTQRRVAALADSGAAREPPDPALALAALSAAFDAWRGRWRGEGFAAIRAAWLARATPIGWQASVRIGADVRRGRFVGLAEDGAMLLERDGRVETIHAGDVMAA
jgi:BirA family biotin operon repressor/biotin-[acetyl-CoA-carboxylase] ligase